MRLHVHQILSGLPVIPFGTSGMVAGAYLAHRLGLWGGGGAPAAALGWVAGLALMFGVGWVLLLPAQYAYDRLVPAQCPGCGQGAAYRRWPSLGRYRCRACGAESTA